LGAAAAGAGAPGRKFCGLSPCGAIAGQFDLVFHPHFRDDFGVYPLPADVNLNSIAEPVLAVRVILCRGSSHAAHFGWIIFGDLNAVYDHAIGIPVDGDHLGRRPSGSGYHFDRVADLDSVGASL
jgi:hypothetical protein